MNAPPREIQYAGSLQSGVLAFTTLSTPTQHTNGNLLTDSTFCFFYTSYVSDGHIFSNISLKNLDKTKKPRDFHLENITFKVSDIILSLYINLIINTCFQLIDIRHSLAILIEAEESKPIHNIFT